jgi:hypothetical protein
MLNATFDIARLAREIARALGDDWKSELQPDSHSPAAHLHGPDGAKVHLVAGPNSAPGRLVIRGILDHKYELSSDGDHHITVSLDKPAAQVAGAIARRLLPDYLPVLAKVQERKRIAEARAATRDALTDALVACLGDGARRGQSGHIDFGSHRTGVNGEVKIPRGDYYVTWEVNVPQDLCQRFAAMVLALRSTER